MLATLLLSASVLAPPEVLSGHAGAVVGDKVFVTGGMGQTNEGHFFRETWFVDPVKGMWTPLPAPRV
ncbi:MAG: hypothetical protein ACHQ50_10580, partial [Fimbriimonadales bacterium]